MGSDNDATRRKHRRSPSEEEAEKSSKRHKHRHHHHRHHRHRSKKHEEDIKQGDDEVVAMLPLPPPPPAAAGTVVHTSRAGGDDDVEEGEILEEAGEVCEENSDSKNLEVVANKTGTALDGELNIHDKFEDGVSLPINTSDNPETFANGNLGHEHQKNDKRRHRESRSPTKGTHKRRDYLDFDMKEDDGSKLSDYRKSSVSLSGRLEYEMVQHSPLNDRYHDEDNSRDRSMSCDPVRERSRSRSIKDEEALLKRRRHHERVESDTDEDGRTQHSNDRRHTSRDLVRGTDRERSDSYSRYLDDRHRGGDARVSERSNERDRDSDRRRGNERERSRDRGSDRDQRREREKERSRDKEMDRDRRREKEPERSWDMELDRGGRREMERERSRDREKRSEKERERELDAEKRRNKERGRSRERDDELDGRRHRERDMSRDKDMARARERGRDRDRERECDRDRYGNRVRDREWENERERKRQVQDDRNRDKSRDIKYDSGKVHNSSTDSLEWSRDKPKRYEDEDEDDDFGERMALKIAEQEEEDLDKIKEESRKRRQAILEKHRNQQLQQQNESKADDVAKDEPVKGPSLLVPSANVIPENNDGRLDSDERASFSVGKSPEQNGILASERTSGVAGLGEGSPKSERSNEKYCDDIFGETPVGVRKMGKGDGLPIVRSALHDNWDDPEGYYSYRFGEILDSRYEIVAAHGKGVFSTVVRAKDLKASADEPEEVAIKIIRNNETMRKAGDLEVSILKKLAGADPENKRHCVRFLSSFKYRNHLCLVFESLHMNLREVLKKFGRNIGLKLTAVRAYAKQLFIALKHLRNCGVLHSDIKPDNMLVNEAKNVLKLCDFGNAMFSGKNEITPYLVSRFYRAPEIILGLQYDHPMDMWSVGCCLYELYTGKVLFPGATNNDMLRLHMELKGPFPKKMLKKGAFVDQHFDQDLTFHGTEEDPVTKKTIKRMMVNIKSKDIGSIINSSPGEDPKMSANFKDLMEKIFVLDPEKRITVYQALAHPFITVVGVVEVKSGEIWSGVLLTGGSFSGMYCFY